MANSEQTEKSFRWFFLVTAIFVTTLVVSNIIAVKLIQLGPLTLPAGVLVFPITYIFGDILTEVYGYARARRVIWTGFFCNLLAVGAIWLAIQLPGAPFWNLKDFADPVAAQKAFAAVLGFAPRLLAASFVAYLVGEFLNSYVLAKMKIRTGGRFLWMRTIGSTIVGEGADSFLFIFLAFGGVFPLAVLWETFLWQWVFKTSYEALVTPVTYAVVRFLKKSEGVDVFDYSTRFNPLKF
ncbi:MAG: queuosine precursor transporter [Calditrichaeota bacterium]|nr:queuosine precursor transporter [Calditrichota bacterium]